MNNNPPPGDNPRQTRNREFYRDRLMHLALREKLGEETPPNLHDQILSELSHADEAPAYPGSPANRRVRRMWQMERRVWLLVGSVAGGLLLLCAALCHYAAQPQIADLPDAPPLKRSTLDPVGFTLPVDPTGSARSDLTWPPEEDDVTTVKFAGSSFPSVRKPRQAAGVAVQLSESSLALASCGLRTVEDTSPPMVVSPATTFVNGEEVRCVSNSRLTTAKPLKRGSKLSPELITYRCANTKAAALAPGNALSEEAEVQIDGFRARVRVTYAFRQKEALSESTFTTVLPDGAAVREFSFRDQTDARGEYWYEHARGPLKRDAIWRKCEAVVAPAVKPEPALPVLLTSAVSGLSTAANSAGQPPGRMPAESPLRTQHNLSVLAAKDSPGDRTLRVKLDHLPADVRREVTVGYDLNLRYDGNDFVYRHRSLLSAQRTGAAQTRLRIQTPAGLTCTLQPEPADQQQDAGHTEVVYQGQREIAVRLQAEDDILLAGEDCFAVAVQPTLPDRAEAESSSHAIFLLDTSLSGRRLYQQRLQMMQQILQQNRGRIEHFAVLMFNIEQHWWRQEFTPNTAAGVQQMLEECGQRLHEGATDLRQALHAAANPAWTGSAGRPPADLFLLSDGHANWGETNMQQLGAPAAGAKVRALFAYDQGEGDTAALHNLATAWGGCMIPAVTVQQQQHAATAHRNRPWNIVDVAVQGGDDVLLPGARRMLAAGEKLLIAGRNQVQPGATVTIRFQRGKESYVYKSAAGVTLPSQLPRRIFAQAAVEKLEAVNGPAEIVEAFSRRDKICGAGASFVLPLQSGSEFNGKLTPDLVRIARESRVADQIQLASLKASRQAAAPRDFFAGCLERASKAEGLGYETPEDLLVAVTQLPPVAFETSQAPLNCELQLNSDAPPHFAKVLDGPQRTAESFDRLVRREAKRRRAAGADDALRALSTLVEQNPQDLDLQIDVAHEVMNWGASENVYPALKRLLVQNPADPRVYHALARCGWQLGRSDIAIICYEVLAGANWPPEYGDVRRAAQAEYLHLLRRVRNRRCDCFARTFAMKRLDELNARLPFQNAELVVTAWWSHSAADVNLLVSEPGGELCYFDNRLSRNGGWLSKDATQNGGPEIYVLKDAAAGEYQIDLHSRPHASTGKQQPNSSVYISAYAGFATPQHQARYRTIKLSPGDEAQGVLRVFVDGRGGVSFNEAAEYSSP